MRYAKRLIKPYRKLYIVATIASLLAVVISLFSPLTISFVIDNIMGNESVNLDNPIMRIFYNSGIVELLGENILNWALLIIGIAVVSSIFTIIRDVYISKASENIAKDLKDRLYNHLQKLPYGYHVGAQTGDLIQRCTSDVETVRRFLANQLMQVVRIVFLSFISGAILFTLNVKLTLITLLIVPFIFFFSYWFLKEIRRTFTKADIKEGELSTVLQENLTGVRVVRAFGMEKYELEKFQEKNDEFKQLVKESNHYLSIYWGVSDFACFLQVGLVVLAGIYMAYHNIITVGTFLVFTMYVNNIVWPLRQAGRIISHYGRMEVALTRINEILFTPEEKETEGAIVSDLKGDIVFENVEFEYRQNKPVLKDINFTVKQGETIAVLGTTGSGKSSLMHLFLRLFDYKSGSIKINGVELKNIRKEHLRERIGIVLQDPFLYSRTIMDNIKMAKDVVSYEEAIEASKIACVNDVIESFGEGYETMVGERGVTLSGGQVQRVAIARTLVKNSDILIFDDSLSAVDTQTDKAIRDNLKEKSDDITTFIISQRITTLMDADRIFVMEKGEITNIGTHEELIEVEGLYKRIWDIQNMHVDEFTMDASMDISN